MAKQLAAMKLTQSVCPDTPGSSGANQVDEGGKMGWTPGFWTRRDSGSSEEEEVLGIEASTLVLVVIHTLLDSKSH